MNKKKCAKKWIFSFFIVYTVVRQISVCYTCTCVLLLCILFMFFLLFQRSQVLGNKIEMEITQLIEKNPTLLRLGLHLEYNDARHRIASHLQRNIDTSKSNFFLLLLKEKFVLGLFRSVFIRDTYFNFIFIGFLFSSADVISSIFLGKKKVHTNVQFCTSFC